MPQAKKPTGAAKKKAAARKPAAKKTAAQTPQVNRMTDTTAPPAPPVDETKPDDATKESEDQSGESADKPPRMDPAAKLGAPYEFLDHEPRRQALEHAGFDHHSAEEKRQAELAEERDKHNARTGDASRGVAGVNS